MVTTLLYGVLLVLGVVLLVVTGVRVFVGGLDGGPERSGQSAGPVGGSARQILDHRYAAGELSTEDYQHRLRVLEERKS